MINFIALEPRDPADQPIRYINMEYVREIQLKKELLQYSMRDEKHGNMRAVDAWEIMISFDDITHDILQLTDDDSATALNAALINGDFSQVVIKYVRPAG